MPFSVHLGGDEPICGSWLTPTGTSTRNFLLRAQYETKEAAAAALLAWSATRYENYLCDCEQHIIELELTPWTQN
jgi:hypothetical protein